MCYLFVGSFCPSNILYRIPCFLVPYFRVLIMGAMVWLGFGIVPRAAVLFVGLERETNKRWSLDDFNVYDKKQSCFFTV